MTTEIVVPKPDTIEQTPRDRVDLAGQALARTISRPTIRGVLAAELAYLRSVRTEADPPTADEILLVQAGEFRSKDEKKAARTFFGNRLTETLNARSIALQNGVLDDAIEQQIRTYGNVLNFIGQSIGQIPQTRRR